MSSLDMDRDLINKQMDRLLKDSKVKRAMKIRCEETNSHDFENCASAMFEIYRKCRWCGKER